MSDFLAEALVVVRPDTSKFRQQLTTQLAALKIPPIEVPILAAGAGLAAASAATASLVTAQTKAVTSGLGLASTEKILNSRYAEQAVLLEAVTAGTLQQAGAQSVLDKANKKTTASLLGAGSASAKLDAALLGLRTAVGSTAVIGLGALALAAIVAGKAVSASIRNFAAFQQELATFRVIAGATADEMRAVSEQANRLGADIRLPAVSAADAAVAMTELARAGLSVEEAMAGARGVLELATAAQISNAEAALITANALNAFGLAGDQAVRVADDLANAANAAQGSISDFGLAFRQSAAVARQVGLSLEDTTSILALFAKNGLAGSDAGTSLRVALLRLVAPSKAAAAEIQKLGLSIRDAQGNLRADVFAQFGEATENLTPALRDASAALIFGQDAIRAVSIGAREGTAGLKIMQFQIDQTGTASEVAAARTEGLGGAFSGLSSGAQTLSISMGRLASPVLTSFIETLSDTVVGINNAIVALGDLSARAADVETPVGRLGDELNEFKTIVEIVGGIRLIGFLAKTAAGSDEASEQISKLNKELQLLQEARIAAATGGQIGFADQLTTQIEGVREQIAALQRESKGLSAIANPLREAVALLKEVRDVRIDFDLPTGDIDRFIRSLERQAAITEQTEGNIQRLRDDFLDLGKAGETSASGVDALTRALKGLRTSASALSDELLRLQNAGAGPRAQIPVLQQQRQVQEDIIANLKADGVQAGEPSLIRKAREEINRIQAEIDSLQGEITRDAEKAASNAEKAQRDRQDALERQLDAATRPTERLLTRAGGTEPLGDDIRFREQLIKILQGQIAIIRKTLGNTEAARDLINDIQDRILAEIDKLQKDRQNFRKQLRDMLEERLERLQRGTELDIELADINENTRKRIAFREKLIRQLLIERKKLKLTGNALKENRNEIARIREEIEEIEKEEKGAVDARKSAAQFFFEQLQAQQGFAANLLGNLITGSTEGLVGVPAPPARTPEDGIPTAAAVQEARQTGGPSAGQVNNTNAILRRILSELKELNGDQKNPEAARQRQYSQAVMDYPSDGGRGW